MVLRAVLILWVAFWGGALLAQTQPAATLIADSIEVTPDRRLIARGNVEAFQGQTRLRATQIVYDRSTGQLAISGPIEIEDGTRGARLLASSAELDADLRDGLLRGARLVLNDQLQLAAVEMVRVQGRYTQLYKTAVTACRICADDPRPPLWQIRAKRVVHDRDERQLYFDGAQLRIRNIPVFYLPRLRLPDPTLERATGFLIPNVRSTSRLGTGVKVPYFIRLGDHRDLTVTPYWSGKTRTLELRYRQAFRRGRIELNGALTDDDLRPGALRAYLFGMGAFDLRDGYKLRFTLETTSDQVYLRDYGYSNADRLRSELRIDRARRDSYRALAFTNFRSLRDGEDNSTLPTNVLSGQFERRFFPARTGGEARLSLLAHVHARTSKDPFDGPDANLDPDGRDVSRLSAQADWRRLDRWGGLEVQWLAGVSADAFHLREDAAFDGFDAALTGTAAVTLRYPMVRRAATGAVDRLEPIAQLAWSARDALDVPNEESTRVEFDEGNLLSLSRFPAPDRREDGVRLALGANWQRIDPQGWQTDLTLGRVLRADADAAFSQTSGLNGMRSDFLLAGRLRLQNGLDLTARTLFDTQLDFSKAEVRGLWSTQRLDLSGSYVWLATDPQEERSDPIAELNFRGGVQLSPQWRLLTNLQYDLDEGRAARTGVGFVYSNECVRVQFRAQREFDTSTSVEPQTSLGLTVSLHGFSTQPAGAASARACERTPS